MIGERRTESPSRATTLEARRLLKSTTALTHAPTSGIYSASRRARTVAPLSRGDVMRLSRRPVDLPSARTLRVDVLVNHGGARARELSFSLGASAAAASSRNAWWAPTRASAQAMPALVEIYEAQVDALLEVASRWKLQAAQRKAGQSGQHPLSASSTAGSAPFSLVSPSTAHALQAEPAAYEFFPLHIEAGSILAELRITVCRMVQLLRRAQLAHDEQKRRAFDFAEPPDSVLRQKRLGELGSADPTLLLSRYDLKYIEASPEVNARARDSKALWTGFNYLLKVLTDFWRLPLPCSSDPFTLEWFRPIAHCDDVHSTLFEPSRWHSPDELAEFRAASAFVSRGVLGSSRAHLLNLQELSLPAGVERSWHSVASLLYGSARAFAQRKAYNDERSVAATVIAMGWRRLQLHRRARARRVELTRRAASRLQQWWRRQAKLALADPWLAPLSAVERRAARRERQQQLERERLLARRRAALKISLGKYPQYDASVRRIQSLARTRAARRAREEKRRRKLGFNRSLIEHGPRLRAAALKWQRQVRRWEEASDLMWSEYRRVVSQAHSPLGLAVAGGAAAGGGAEAIARAESSSRSGTEGAGAEADDVASVTAALRRSLERAQADAKARLARLPPSAESTYFGLLAAISHNLGVTTTLQAAVDEFVEVTEAEPLGVYKPPKGAVIGDNPPRAWLRAQVERLSKADESAPQHARYRRPVPYSKAVLQELSEEAHARHCELRAVHAARRLVARLCGVRDVLGEAAEQRAAAVSKELQACATAPLGTLRREEAIAAEAAEAAESAQRSEALKARRHSEARWPKRPPTLGAEFAEMMSAAGAARASMAGTGGSAALSSPARAQATQNAPAAGTGNAGKGGAAGASAGAPSKLSSAHGVSGYGGEGGEGEGFPWARQLLIGLYGHLVDCGATLEARAAEAVPLRHARALTVLHEARSGGLEALTELVAEFGMQARYTPKVIVGRIQEELAARSANLAHLLPQFKPAAMAYAELRHLQERCEALGGELKLVQALEDAQAREEWTQLQRARISLVGRLAFSTRAKPEYKAAVTVASEREGRLRAARELREKTVYPPSFVVLRCELAPYAREPLAEGAMWAACEAALINDLSNYLGCPDDQLSIEGGDLAPPELRPAAALVRLRIHTTENERLGLPHEITDALADATDSIARDFVLRGIAEALGVPEEAPAISIERLELPDYKPLNVMRALREAHGEAKAEADQARETLSLVAAERTRRFRAAWGKRSERRRQQAPVVDGPLGELKRVAHEALGREAVLRQLEKECPPRDEARAARLWLPVQLDAIAAEASKELAAARKTIARFAPVYAERKRLKAELRDVTARLLALRARLPRYVLDSLTVRVPEPRDEDGWMAREAYLDEKRLVQAIVREAARLDAGAAELRGRGASAAGAGTATAPAESASPVKAGAAGARTIAMGAGSAGNSAHVRRASTTRAGARKPSVGGASTAGAGAVDAGAAERGVGRRPAIERSAWAAIKASMQMSILPSLCSPGALVTPRMVAAMAARLGISLRPADGELFLLPVAVEAITCPLPSGWLEESASARSEDESDDEADAADAGGTAAARSEPAAGLLGAYRFRHSLTGEVRPEHPLLPAFAEFVAVQRRRKTRARKWSHLEGWMQFATEDGQVCLFAPLLALVHRASLCCYCGVAFVFAPPVHLRPSRRCSPSMRPTKRTGRARAPGPHADCGARRLTNPDCMRSAACLRRHDRPPAQSAGRHPARRGPGGAHAARAARERARALGALGGRRPGRRLA